MKNKTIKTAVLVFGATLFFANSSFGQPQNRQEKSPPTFKELLEKMDADEDGKLSKDEIKGPLKKDFDKVDTDEDGFISAEEFAEAPKPKRGPKRQ